GRNLRQRRRFCSAAQDCDPTVLLAELAVPNPRGMSSPAVPRSATARRVSWIAPLIAACVFSINSCATRKAPSQHTIAIEALPAGTSIPPTWSAPSTLGGVANEWLSTFHDPQLAAIVAEAIANNPDLRQAGERVEQARQTVSL